MYKRFSLKSPYFLFLPLYGLFFLLTTACLSGRGHFISDELGEEAPLYFETYPFDFVSVLKATRLALKEYSLAVDDNEEGVLETRVVKQYKSKGRQKRSFASEKPFRYKIRLQLTRLNDENSSPSTQVSIFKELIYKKDFFSTENRSFGDGLEEQVILYRIGRELEIRNQIKKKFEEESFSEPKK